MAREVGSGRMIEQTSVQISALRESWHVERELRYARRNRIRYIDRMLDELEMLNMAEETQMPPDLALRVQRLAAEMEHPLVNRAAGDLRIQGPLDSLYDLQGGRRWRLRG